MHVIKARNVNDAFIQGLEYLDRYGRRESSRAGDVIVAPCPVTTVYYKPQERVLFDPIRDANPFFHLFESLWMLAGRNDATWLDRFVGNFSERFAENGIQHGAYGHRWRRAFGMGFDQLDIVVNKLKQNPQDRQCVIQMWDAANYVTSHSAHGANDLVGNWKDRPCNTNIYLRVRQDPKHHNHLARAVLDITVCCRSNDAIWGAYGANAVHFSMLHEYLAARIGVEMGAYYQVSNNFHAYVDTFDKQQPAPWDYYSAMKVQPASLVTDSGLFDTDLLHFMEWTDSISPDELPVGGWNYYNTWFRDTAEPMMEIHWNWKGGRRDFALAILTEVSLDIASDWKLAAQQWMMRRLVKENRT